jgi:GTPase involved in cell partitioning and DNA repair
LQKRAWRRRQQAFCTYKIQSPWPGPDGGNGGRGGHIILKGNRNLWTLLHLRYFKNVLAENGEGGMKNNMSGRDWKDVYIEVPLGTIVKDEETGEQEAEIMDDGQEVIWVKGGKGAWVMPILQRLQTRHLNMHNPVCPVWKDGRFLN